MRLLVFPLWRRLVLAAERVWNALDVPLRLPILTTRQLMVLIAVVAILIGTAMAIPRAGAYREKAETQAALASNFQQTVGRRLAEARKSQTALSQFRRGAGGADRLTLGYFVSRINLELIDANYNKEMADYHAHLSATYRRAMWFPWGSVPRNPSPPLDPLRPSVRPFVGSAYSSELDGARSVSFSPDGATVALGCRDKTIRLLEPLSGNLRMTIRMPDRPSSKLAFSPDGMMIAAAGEDQIVHLWDVATGRVLRALTWNDRGTSGSAAWSMVTHVSFSPDSRTVAVVSSVAGANAASSFHAVKLFEAKTGELKWERKGKGGWASSVAFSPDGKTLAYDDLVAMLLDPQTGALKATLKPEIGHVLSVLFSPDGRTLAGVGTVAPAIQTNGGPGRITLWNVSSGAILRTLDMPTGRVQAVAFSPDGKTIAAGGTGRYKDVWNKLWASRESMAVSEVRLWDVESGSLIWTAEGECSDAFALDFAPNGNFLAFCDPYYTYLLDAKTGKLRRILIEAQVEHHVIESSSNGKVSLPAMMGDAAK
jgi:WD40 repeat protein